jgi:hypothetical protein
MYYILGIHSFTINIGLLSFVTFRLYYFSQKRFETKERILKWNFQSRSLGQILKIFCRKKCETNGKFDSKQLFYAKIGP